MRQLTILIIILFSMTALQCNNQNTQKQQEEKKKVEFAIAIHGGAGNTSAKDFPENERKKYKKKLQKALKKGTELLKNDASAIETVEQVINIMENSPLFNAGKGAVFTHQGTNELDASIMNGANLNAGAVAGVKNIKNPITAAKYVMNSSDHVLLAGSGASRFAEKEGLELVDTSYFYTERRWKSLQRRLNNEKNGTVGCVVLDKEGNLAAGTSTGGRTNKKYGRIGDSPIIGAGTYANNNTCAISATGHGEYFIRYTVAHDISALMEYKNLSLQKAADKVIKDKLVKAEGDGGIIGVDKFGNITFSFNTKMMFRGFAKSSGETDIKIF